MTTLWDYALQAATDQTVDAIRHRASRLLNFLWLSGYNGIKIQQADKEEILIRYETFDWERHNLGVDVLAQKLFVNIAHLTTFLQHTDFDPGQMGGFKVNTRRQWIQHMPFVGAEVPPQTPVLPRDLKADLSI